VICHPCRASSATIAVIAPYFHDHVARDDVGKKARLLVIIETPRDHRGSGFSAETRAPLRSSRRALAGAIVHRVRDRTVVNAHSHYPRRALAGAIVYRTHRDRTVV